MIESSSLISTFPDWDLFSKKPLRNQGFSILKTFWACPLHTVSNRAAQSGYLNIMNMGRIRDRTNVGPKNQLKKGAMIVIEYWNRCGSWILMSGHTIVWYLRTYLDFFLEVKAIWYTISYFLDILGFKTRVNHDLITSY